MTATLPTTGQLPASRTFTERHWSFVPKAETTTPGIGTLTIVQGKRDLDSYAIDVTGTSDGGSEVIFVRKDSVGDMIAVRCDKAGVPVSCSCPGHFYGHRKGIVCKHRAAVKELRSEDMLPRF